VRPFPSRRLCALPLVAALCLAGCGGQQADEAPSQPAGPRQVELAYTTPAGMSEVAVPSASPSGGIRYDIKLFQGDGCELRVVRLLLPKGDGTEDQDATYNMLGAIMEQSGIPTFSTNGLLVPGEPGPVPTLVVSGSGKGGGLRAAGRISNTSLQGYQLVYGCGRRAVDESVWKALVDSLRVDGFTGSLKEH